MTSAPGMNLISLPWIPVRRPDGTVTEVGLREVFLDAHTFAELGADSPLEHDALTRFLTTVTALVVRAAGPDWDPRAEPRFPVDAVETALASVSGSLDLADPVNPFMQDVAEGLPAGAGVVALSLDRPNDTVQAWHFRGQLGEHPQGQVTWARLGVLLVTFWYFSATSNVDIDGRKQTGSLCGKAGNGLHLFWRGPSLAHSLLANTMSAWADGSDLPAWADRDGAISGAKFAGAAGGMTPLWWGSYSPNTVIVWVDEATGLPAFSCTGGSPRQPKGMPAPLTRNAKDNRAKYLFAQRYPGGAGPDGAQVNEKKELKAIFATLAREDVEPKEQIKTLVDTLRASDPAGTLGFAKPERLSSMSPDLATLRNLSVWYQAGAAELLNERVVEVVLKPGGRGGRWVLEFCHTSTKNVTVPVYTSAAWVTREPKESALYTLDPQEAKAVLAVAGRVEAIANLLCKQLSKGSTLAELVTCRRELRDRFYFLADAACTRAIQDAVDGREMAQDVIEAVRAAALDAFDDVLGPFAGSALSISIIQARTRLQFDLADADASNKPGRRKPKTVKDGPS